MFSLEYFYLSDSFLQDGSYFPDVDLESILGGLKAVWKKSIDIYHSKIRNAGSLFQNVAGEEIGNMFLNSSLDDMQQVRQEVQEFSEEENEEVDDESDLEREEEFLDSILTT